MDPLELRGSKCVFVVVQFGATSALGTYMYAKYIRGFSSRTTVCDDHDQPNVPFILPWLAFIMKFLFRLQRTGRMLTINCSER